MNVHDGLRGGSFQQGAASESDEPCIFVDERVRTGHRSGGLAFPTRPPALRTDGSNAFARFSMQVRVPQIIREVVVRNPDYPPSTRHAIEQLAASIEGDAPLPPPRAPAPDVDAWTSAHARHASESWLNAEWFHAELAAYRELAACSRFWETGRDPFAPAKEEELVSERLWTRLSSALAVAGSRQERLASLLDACLWGNRVDLSYRVAANRERGDDDLLVDDLAPAAARLATGRRIDVIADNTGTELALDLALVDAILEDPDALVTVHVKAQPVFVSDALAQDVWRMLAVLGERAPDLRALGERLRAGFDRGRLRIAPDPFWSGPRFLWEAPAHITGALANASIVVIKGDANYRRLVGDAVWSAGATFSDAAAYLGTSVACARTLKSDARVGLPRQLEDRLDAENPRWRIDGSRGVVQLHESSTPPAHGG
jgi:hypothetical protein